MHALEAGAALENPTYHVLHAALASLYAELGDIASARSTFESLAGDDFGAVPFDEEWLVIVALLSDACAVLGDAGRAAVLYDRLEPYGQRVLVAPIEMALGSAARPLGKLAATLGRTELAARWFEQAARENARAGANPWAAHARLDHARLLLAQGEPAAAKPPARAGHGELPRARHGGVDLALPPFNHPRPHSGAALT